MYSTCTFCHGALGRNEALEHFPVGRRIAFDQSKGRLWAVCPSCRQWNLSPLETRWEAIEEGERLYRDTRLRVSTDQIGLARLKDGTEIIRIGEPQRPEFAAWRYGDRFSARFRRTLMWGGVGVAAFAGYAFAGPALGLTVGGLAWLPHNIVSTLVGMYESRLVVGRFRDDQGPLYVTATYAQLSEIIVAADDPKGWAVRAVAVRAAPPPGRFASGPSLFGDHRVILTGDNAEEAARLFLPQINRRGARKQTVAEAVKLLEEVGDKEAVFKRILRPGREGGWSATTTPTLPAYLRLAMEIAVHEESERRALQGELAALEAQWREADEIAAIADNLTMPLRVTQRLERLLDGR